LHLHVPNYWRVMTCHFKVNSIRVKMLPPCPLVVIMLTCCRCKCISSLIVGVTAVGLHTYTFIYEYTCIYIYICIYIHIHAYT
jgi:hypothetical protein